jgi:mannose-1-phosphate guanylyltransferase/mannose-6-phosphate isomerase
MDYPTRLETNGNHPVVPVLMAGGSGSRLWPLSRESYPKQFLALHGAHSLLQNTALRARMIPNAAAPVVIGADAHRFLIAEQLRDAGIAGSTLLLEPEGRDTAPAAAVAAHYVASEVGPEAIVFLMAADHVITDLDAFVAAATLGAELASQGHVVTFGITPTGPETGFGYLRAGAALPEEPRAQRVEAFVEKPDAARAQAFLDAGNHYWNSGMFMFRADRFLDVLQCLEPALSHSAHAAVSLAAVNSDGLSLNVEAFSSCRKVSVDYAVMEKLHDIALVPLDAGWDDVGSWNFLAGLPATDDHANRARGDVLLQDSRGNLVHAQSRLVTLIGVEDHVVVETEDAILVAPRSRVQDVKGVVQKLKAEERAEVVAHHRVYRPWGYYESIAGGERFQVKRIMVKPGQKLSLQMHHHRAEHWVVVKGTARVTCGDKEFLLCEDQSTYIPLGNVHRLENPGLVPLELIEVQSGAYLGEDDIVRLEDVYGRTQNPSTASDAGAGSAAGRRSAAGSAA